LRRAVHALANRSAEVQRLRHKPCGKELVAVCQFNFQSGQRTAPLVPEACRVHDLEMLGVEAAASRSATKA
jgi:hypothetical protein